MSPANNRPQPRREPLESCSSGELVSRFRAAAAKRGRAWLNKSPTFDNAKFANAAFAELDQIWAELARRNAEDRLHALLADDEDAGVRLAAAGRLLAKFPDDAEAVLQKLSVQKTVIGLSAAATLYAKRLYGC